jgi:ABC-2 type transport system ATP-binding protein
MLAVDGAGVGKAFAGRWVLKDVDVSVEPGQCLAVLGRNGSGKSTLLRLVAGALRPDRGTLRVAGHDAGADPDAVRGAVGVHMGEDRAWYWRLSGRRNLEFFASLFPRGAVDRHRVDELLGLVGLAHDADRRVGDYSTGMRARLGLARALLPRAPVLVLDEPTRSVDATGRSEFHAVLTEVMTRLRTTVALATHDLEEAATLADQVVVLDGGRVSSREVGASAAALAVLVGASET